jgi:hypothetical protein
VHVTSGCNRPQKLSLVLPKIRQNNRHLLRRLSQAFDAREMKRKIIAVIAVLSAAIVNVQKTV